MSFDHPAALWGMLALPPLVALLLWQAQRAHQVVPSLLLWERVLDAGGAGPRRRWALFDPAVLAAAVFVALAILALARPALVVSRPAPGKLLLLVDRTASMGTLREDGGTRLDAAVKRCESLFNSLSGDWGVAIRSWPERSPGPLYFSLSRRQALSQLQRLRPTSAGGDGREALRQALASLPQGATASVLVLTDAPLDPLPSIAAHPVRLIAVGGPSHNVGITGFHVDAAQGSVFAAIRSFAPAVRPVTATAYVDGAVIGSKALRLPPRGRGTVTFHHPLRRASTVRVTLSPEDELPADNAAWAVRAPTTLEVACAGQPDLLLRHALEAAGARVTQVAADADTQAYPLAIYNCVLPRRLVSPHVVLIAPPGNFDAVTVGKQVELPKVVVTNSSHPFMRHVSGLDDVQIARATRLSLPAQYTCLVEAAGQPLIAAAGGPGRSRLLLAFEPEKSSWPLKASFPVFWLNVVDNARPGRPAAGGFSFVHTGQVVSLRARDRGALRVSGPTTRFELTPTPEGLVTFTPQFVGLYRCEGATTESIAANLLDPAESDTRGNRTVPDPQDMAQALSAPAAVKQTRTDLSPWLLLASVVFLGMFWLTQRR